MDNPVLTDYLSYLKSVKGLSPMTIKGYSTDIQKWIVFLYTEGITEDEVDHGIIRGFFAHLHKMGLSESSVNRMLSALKGYYDFQLRNNIRTLNPFLSIRNLKEKRSLPDFLSEQEIKDLFLLPKDDFWGLRDRLILELLYSTGCRVSEISNMNDFKTKSIPSCIIVRGKGDKDRYVFFCPETRKTLGLYKEKRGKYVHKTNQDAQKALLLNQKGCRLTQRGIALIIEKYIMVSGISKKVSPHTFRHTFATHLIDRGADIRIVQEMLGHKSLSTTQIYTHMGVQKLRLVYQKAHPHAVVKKQLEEKQPEGVET